MKSIIAALISILALTFVANSADAPMGKINFKNAPLDTVLSVYKELCDGQLVQSSQVKQMHTAITVSSDSPLSKSDTRKLLEKALVEQAGIVITPLGDRRISVTFNDALPIHAVKN